MALQRYSVIERLDAGGMAEVFKGKATSIQGIERLVAIKRILPSLTKNKKFVAMFLDEARLSMNLTHANIVQVFDLGVADSTYFIVMEYVDGTNLKVIFDAARKTGYRIPLPQIIYIMMGVCRALDYAHTKKDINGRPLGIIHRDVSPPNVMLSTDGEVKLMDFGLAKAKSQVESTDPGVVKGKFAYLSPEAAQGEEIDLRTDVFAVGIILWEILAGQRLFVGGSDLETLERVRRCEIPSLRQHNPEVTPELERLVLKALAPKPQDRYASAQELGDELAHYIFSRGLKVTSYDVSQLVQMVLSGKLGEAPKRAKPLTLIDRLIQDEMAAFESLDRDAPSSLLAGDPAESYDGSRPLSFGDLSIGSAAPTVEEPEEPEVEEALDIGVPVWLRPDSWPPTPGAPVPLALAIRRPALAEGSVPPGPAAAPPAPPAWSAGPPPPPMSAASPAAEGAGSEPAPKAAEAATAAKGGSRMALVVAILALVLAAAGGAVYYYLFMRASGG